MFLEHFNNPSATDLKGKDLLSDEGSLIVEYLVSLTKLFSTTMQLFSCT